MARHRRGFTLIELSVGMAVVAVLLLLVAPRYIGALDRSRETVAEHNLQQIRTAIDQYRADRGYYPASVRELVDLRYLRNLPVDPAADAADWETVPPPAGESGQVFDVRRRTGAAASAAAP